MGVTRAGGAGKGEESIKRVKVSGLRDEYVLRSSVQHGARGEQRRVGYVSNVLRGQILRCVPLTTTN